MAGTFEVLLFNDETSDFREPLERLCERRKGVLFLHFIDRLNETLRDEIRKQPRHVQAQIPHFTDVQTLVKQYHASGSRNQILETTLACICQLGSVISYFDDHPSQYLVPSDTVLVGLCTGLLSAAAVSGSQSLLGLIPVALKVVRVAFRLGVKVNGTAQRLSTPNGVKGKQSWSTLVVGVEKEAAAKELAQFNENKGLPRASQAYVSSSSKGAITVSGPPETLKALFSESESFRKRKTVKLDIFGPFHASHLYSAADVDEILQPVLGDDIKPHFRVFPALSADNGGPPDVSTEQYFKKVVNDILINPLSLDKIIAAVTSEVNCSDKSFCNISSVGPSNASHSLASALKTGTKVEVTVGEQLGTVGPVATARNDATKIAIVGMGGRFPNADDLEKFWGVLEQGLDLHRTIPPDRFDVDAHYDPTGKKKNTSHTPYGCFIEEPGLFDPKFFGMSPREAYQTDPMQRLGITTAFEALEMSGFVPNRTPSSMLDRIGTFYGQTSDDWRQVNAAQNIDAYYIPGTIRAFAGGRINYHFKFSGPSYNVDTACSSSFAAIQLACTSLRAKECDTAVAGGLNVMTTPDLFAGLSRAHFLSKTGSCKTFDDGADGFCRGDGVGSIILKRLEDAELDNDPILGVILGTSTNHSANAVSITQPHPQTQETLYKKILTDTGVDAREVSYVEMHGTGTQAGDGAEMTSITNVFAPRNGGRLPEQTLHLGALKSNIGHGEASAGVASLIKVLLMLQKNAIPPHVGVKGVMNHTFPKDLNERGVRIAFKETPWLPAPGGKRRAYLNNFSAAGGNTGVLLEEGPRDTFEKDDDPRTNFVVSVTARSASSLKKNIQNLIDYLQEKPNTSLPSLSYTTTARRIHQPFRVSFSVSSIPETIKALTSAKDETIKAVSEKISPKVSFVFTGQGSHYASLGKQLYEDSNQFRSDIIDFNNIGLNQGFPSFLPLIDGSVEDIESLLPVVVQLGLCCIQMALARLWKSWGVTPTAVLGHSLGEYAALNVAGVLSVSDTIFLVGRRAELLQEHCTAGTHAMLAVGASLVSIVKTLQNENIEVDGVDGGRETVKNIEVACQNGPKETVISGTTKLMTAYSKVLKAAGLKCLVLATPYAFHSSQVDAIMEPFEKLARSINFQKPAIPVISPLLSEVVTVEEVFGPDYLASHARKTVNFEGALVAAQKENLVDANTIWVEIGPAPVCSSFVKSSLGNDITTTPSLRKKEDAWKTITSSLTVLHRKGVSIDWNEMYRGYGTTHRVLALPRYSFDLQNYWIEYLNNWQLTKGDLLQAPSPTKVRALGIPSTTVQKVIKEDFGNVVTVTAESDLSNPALNEAVFGHLVNGSGLVPSAIYADMALTLTGHLHKKVNKKAEEPGMDVRHLEIVKPIIAKGQKSKDPQIVRITATAEKPLKAVNVKYTTLAEDGKTWDLHATCTVEFGDTKTWLANWARSAYLIQPRIDLLNQGLKTGVTEKLDRKKTYERFSALVQYGKKYCGMKEVVLDSKNFEATSLVEFQATDNDGDFDVNPYWIDNVAHLSGFILNGSDAVDSTKQVYISHGWESCQMGRPISGSKSYRTYVKMQPGAGKTMVGDVYVFDGQEIVGLVGGVKFQAIPRAVLNKVLPPANGYVSPVAMKASKPKETKVEAPAKTTKAAPKAAPAASAPRQDDPSIGLFLGIIADELGMEVSELPDSAVFDDIGVDSLMALSMTGRIREELDMEVPVSLFTDQPTIGKAKAALLGFKGQVAQPTEQSESPPAAQPEEPEETEEPEEAEEAEEDVSSPQQVASSADSDSVIDGILEIISDELGMEPSDLPDSAVFDDIGVDSLMSLSITGRIREELDLEVPTSLFTDNPTIGDAKNAVRAMTGSDSSETTTSGGSTGITTPDQDTDDGTSPDVQALDIDKRKLPATSILLQGNPKTASKILFLFPDGSGSATSYASFPRIDRDVCVYGLNCPYMKTPSDFTNGIVGVSQQYIAEIRRRQEHGPYYLGGWSAGGVLAYQSAIKLMEMGEVTERLILIDSPCPIDLEPLPSSLLHFIDSIGLLGSQSARGTPEWLIPHFEASIANLTAYKPKKPEAGKAPKAFLIWGRDGLLDNHKGKHFTRYSNEAKSIKFLLDSRAKIGYNGWDRLLGEENVTAAEVPGNHFTLIRDPIAKNLAGLLRSGLGMEK